MSEGIQLLQIESDLPGEWFVPDDFALTFQSQQPGKQLILYNPISSYFQ